MALLGAAEGVGYWYQTRVKYKFCREKSEEVEGVLHLKIYVGALNGWSQAVDRAVYSNFTQDF